MEATTPNAPVSELPEPEIRVNPADIVDAKELSAEELKALLNADETEAPVDNPHISKEGATKALTSLVGGIVGFAAVGYLNNYIMSKIVAGASTAPTANTLLGYAAVIFVVEVIVSVFLYSYGMKHAGKTGEFACGFAAGVGIAGFGTVFSQYLVNSGTSNPLLAAVNFSGKPLVPGNRVVST